jgi:putative SOS response-associated peptidase YedK
VIETLEVNLMCGRFVRQKDVDAIVRDFGVEKVACGLAPSYNVAPTQQVGVIIEDGIKQLVSVRWGLVPSWASGLSVGNTMINARAETVAHKGSFREAFEKRRCLVVADGFYEWRKEGKTKQPIFIRLKTDRAFGFAGLYENWLSPDGRNIRTCTIITTEPNEKMKTIHNRMPVIIPMEQEETWLRSESDPTRLLSLLKPYPAEEMQTYEVSALVNSPANDSPECMRPATAQILAQPVLPFQ